MGREVGLRACMCVCVCLCVLCVLGADLALHLDHAVEDEVGEHHHRSLAHVVVRVLERRRGRGRARRCLDFVGAWRSISWVREIERDGEDMCACVCDGSYFGPSPSPCH